MVDIPNGPPGAGPPHDYSSELWIVEADEIEKGPIAKVKTGLALRSQVHGAWVSRAKLDAEQAAVASRQFLRTLTKAYSLKTRGE